MRPSPRRFAAALLCLLLAGPALASAQPEAARATLQTHHRRALVLLARPPSEARARELDALLDTLLDYDELAKGTLGYQYDERSRDERERFVRLLHDLVQKSYRENLERTLRFEVRFLGVETRGDAVVVRTRARSRSNPSRPAVAIDYTMHSVDGVWRVFDVTTNGTSLVQSYRTQFNRILARDGWNGLMERMRARLDGTDVRH